VDIEARQRAVDGERRAECRGSLIADRVVAESQCRQRAVDLERLRNCYAALWAELVFAEVEGCQRASEEQCADGPHPKCQWAVTVEPSPGQVKHVALQPDSTRQPLAEAFTHSLANFQRVVPPCRPPPQLLLGEPLVPRALLAQCTCCKVLLEGKVRRLKKQWLSGQQADQRQLILHCSAAELVQDLL